MIICAKHSTACCNQICDSIIVTLLPYNSYISNYTSRSKFNYVLNQINHNTITYLDTATMMKNSRILGLVLVSIVTSFVASQIIAAYYVISTTQLAKAEDKSVSISCDGLSTCQKTTCIENLPCKTTDTNSSTIKPDSNSTQTSLTSRHQLSHHNPRLG